MKKLLTYLTAYRKESIIAPLFKMLEATFELFVPLVMAQIIDVGIARGEDGISYILTRGGVLILLAIIGLTCSLIAQYFAAKAAVGMATGIRSALYRHIHSLTYTELDKVGTSTLVTRMTADINQVQNGVNLFLRLFLRSPFIVAGAVIMAFRIDRKISAIFLLATLGLSIVVFGVMKLSVPMHAAVQKQLDRVVLSTRENLTGVRVIRAFNRQQEEKSRYEENNTLLRKLQLKVGNVSALMNPITYVIVNFAIVAIIHQGGIAVNTGRITQGEVVALVNYMSQILVELVKLANLIVTLTKAMACGKRISDSLEIEPSLPLADHPIDAREIARAWEEGSGNVTEGKATRSSQDIAVSMKNASLKYAGASAQSLSKMNLTFHRGETIGVIGSTGCGKSSLIQLIPRFYDVEEGVVEVLGHDVKEYDLRSLREIIGVVPQKAVLFRGTIRDNLLWGKKDATEEELWEALDVAQARDFVEGKEKGLDSWISQGGNNLSGGQKQRLTIARAVISKTPILILDDSSSALDYATEKKLRESLSHLSHHPTLILVSQRASTVRHADQIVVLDDGLLSGVGTHEELMETCEVYQEIVHSQKEQ
ncbi:MAG: ABC transporter ATP-binding protein/permease [Lachnospiraceae bacterium]|nr:ABC transporter ATP-binding protein/permease [Lachnospiraceae bacterium]